MFEDKESKVGISFDISEYDDSAMSGDASLVEITIYAQNHKPIYHRRYIKMQTILANVGGMIKAIMII